MRLNLDRISRTEGDAIMSDLREVKRKLLFLLAYNRSELRQFIAESSSLGIWNTEQLLKMDDSALLLEMQNWSLSHQSGQAVYHAPDLDFDFSDLDNPFRDDGRHTRQTPYQPDEDDDSADLDPSKQGL